MSSNIFIDLAKKRLQRRLAELTGQLSDHFLEVIKGLARFAT